MPDTYIYSYGDKRAELLGPHGAGDGAGARRRLGRARARSAAGEPGANADPGLDRREGSGARRRAGANRRGLHQPAAARHAAAIGSDRDLCPERGRHQEARSAADPRRPRDRVALQHLSGKRAAARPDRQSGRGLAARRRAAGADRRSLFRRRRHRRPCLCQDARRAQPQRRAIPAQRRWSSRIRRAMPRR